MGERKLEKFGEENGRKIDRKFDGEIGRKLRGNWGEIGGKNWAKKIEEKKLRDGDSLSCIEK